MKEYIYGFEKLIVWQKARDFVVFVYNTTKQFPDEEKYGLTNQIRRAAVSVTANIAEGAGRRSAKEQAHYTQMSFSSLMETLSHLYIAQVLGYIDIERVNALKVEILEISNLLNALRKAQLKRV